LAISAFFSVAETSLMAVSHHKIRHLEKTGLKSAKLASKLLIQTDKLLSVILICNNLSNAAAASLVTIISIQLIGSGDDVLLISTLSVTFLIVIFSEITPKVIAAAHAEKLALGCSFILFPLLNVLYPIVIFINFFVLSILKIFNIKLNFNEKNLVSMEELKSVITTSTKAITTKNQTMLINLLDLENSTVVDVMIPHTNVEFISLNQDISEIIKKIKTYHHDYILVKDDNFGSILGLLNIRKLTKFIDDYKSLDTNKIKEITDQSVFVASNTSLYKQIQNFQENKYKIAIVVNEHGDFMGIVTIEDILEEITGEFNLNLPSDESKIIEDDDGWIIEGSCSLKKINKALNILLKSKKARTLNGFILEYFEDIPEPNTSFKIKNLTFEIINAHNKSIKTIKLFK
jgi:Mg2+/Co2+ transporter CorB